MFFLNFGHRQELKHTKNKTKNRKRSILSAIRKQEYRLFFLSKIVFHEASYFKV